jgi:hypothetical protein
MIPLHQEPIRPISRRRWICGALAALAAVPALGLDTRLQADRQPNADADVSPPTQEDLRRLERWIGAVRAAGLHHDHVPSGRTAAAIGQQALGTPYEAFTLEQYLHAGASPARTEPLTLSLTRFDCVTLVETCLALARLARSDDRPDWNGYAREMQRLRYRAGRRDGYLSRLHYFSEWIADNARRGQLRDIGEDLGGVIDDRPLRFMSSHRDSYPALADDTVFEAIKAHERRLDAQPRHVVPTDRIPQVQEQIQTGDVLAFATSIEGLDVTHAALAWRDEADVLRVLHAPMAGGVVEITRSNLHEYVKAIRRSIGILIARPQPAPREL